MAVSYTNIFFDYCLDPLRDLFISEYNYGKIYIAPKIVHQDPFSIRMWADSTETVELFTSAWQKQYNVIISLYEIEQNPSEGFYKQFLNDTERIYSLLFNNQTKSTTIGSDTYTWIDGVCESVEINDFEDDEEGIEGLNVAKFDFNCKIIRENS